MEKNRTRWVSAASERRKISAGLYRLGPFEIKRNPHTVKGAGWRWSGPSWQVTQAHGARTVYVPDVLNDGEPIDCLARDGLHPGVYLAHTLKEASAWCRRQLENEIGPA